MHSKKALAVFLSKLRPFEAPDPSLEQYTTDSEIAASILWQAYLNGDIVERRIADLGCGTGILGIGALALGAAHVTFVELDTRAFQALMQNLALLEHETGEELDNYEILEWDLRIPEQHALTADVVIENPPFGTRKSGADVLFVQRALKIAPIVYSLHKTSTEPFLIRKITQIGRITNTTRFSYPLKRTLPQHTRKIHRIDVSCLRIER